MQLKVREITFIHRYLQLTFISALPLAKSPDKVNLSLKYPVIGALPRK